MENFTKYPYEVFPIEADFEDKLATGEALVSLNVSMEVFEDDTDETDRSSAMVVVGSVQVSGTKVLGKVQAGTEDTTYYVKFKTGDTDGNNRYSHIVHLTVNNDKET